MLNFSQTRVLAWLGFSSTEINKCKAITYDSNRSNTQFKQIVKTRRLSQFHDFLEGIFSLADFVRCSNDCGTFLEKRILPSPSEDMGNEDDWDVFVYLRFFPHSRSDLVIMPLKLSIRNQQREIGVASVCFIRLEFG